MAAPCPPRALDTVVFDVGKVLIDWDPRFLYRKLIADAAAMERFLAEVCTQAWNEEQDRGRSFAEAVAELVARHPAEAALIRAYDERWEEMVPGEIPGSRAIVEALKARGVRLYALTNFSAEKFALTRRRFPVFSLFDGILVSGEEGLIKPDPRIYALIQDRFDIDPSKALFTDDSPRNIAAAEAAGFHTHLFRDAAGLRQTLMQIGLL